MKILLIGSNADTHLELLSQQAKKHAVDYRWLDIYQDYSAINYYFNAGIRMVTIDQEPLHNFSGIYWRNPIQQVIPTDQFSIKELHQHQEIWNILLPIDNMSTIPCINPMLVNIKLENKIFQLDLAQQLQLKIPDTLISSDRNSILEFMQEKNCFFIQKHLGMAWDEENYPAATTLFNANRLSLQNKFPVIYQNQIKRATELRVYVVGNQMVTVKIVLRPEYATQVDWRVITAHSEHDYQLYTQMSEDTCKKLLQYHQAAQLIYAAYDFIVDEDGNEYFLECNPTGNWHFLPAPITNKIASLLLQALTKQKIDNKQAA